MAGEYNTRVTVQRRDESAVSDMNEPVASWKTHCVTWASVNGASGREFSAGDQTTADVGYQVRMRASERTRAITPKMRLAFQGRTLEIVSVVDLENRHIEMMLLCREVA